jgi:hypothetical protein
MLTINVPGVPDRFLPSIGIIGNVILLIFNGTSFVSQAITGPVLPATTEVFAIV